MAVITFVQSASANGQAQANAGEPINFATTPVQGNFLLFFGSSASIHDAPPSGYSLIDYSTGEAADVMVDYRYAGVAEPTNQTPIYNSSIVQNYQSILGLELNAVNASNPIGQISANGNVTVSNNQWIAPSVTTSTLSSIFAVYSYEDYQGLTSFTPPSGWSIIGPINSNQGAETGNPIRLVLLYQFNVQPGTYAPALTTTGSPSVYAQCDIVTTAIQPVSGNIYINNLSDTLFLNFIDLTTESNRPLVTESGLALVTEQSKNQLDSSTNNNILNRTSLDTSAFSDSTSKGLNNSRNPNETFTTSDVNARISAYTRTPLVTSAFNDSVTTTTMPYTGAHTYSANLIDFALVQAQIDLLTETSNFLTTENNLLLVTEQLVASNLDSVHSYVHTQKATADTFYPSDSQTRLIISPHNISETITTFDTISHVAILTRSTILNGTITDSNSRFVECPRLINQAFTTIDSIVHYANDQFAITENLPFSDSFTRQVTYYFSFTETYDFLDDVSANSGKITTVEENFITQDSLIQSYYLTRAPYDSTGGESDFLNNNSFFFRNFSNSSPTSDFEDNQSLLTRAITNSFVFSDYNNLQYLFNQSNLNDFLVGNNNLHSSKILYRNVVATSAFSDVLHQNELTHVALTDTFSLSDFANRNQTNVRYLANVSFLNANVTSGDIRHDFLAELFNFSDASVKSVVNLRNLTESFTVTNQTNYTKKKIINFSEIFNTSVLAHSNFIFERIALNNSSTFVDLNNNFITARNLSFTEVTFSDATSIKPIHVRVPVENINTQVILSRNLSNTRTIADTFKLINDTITKNSRFYTRYPGESFSFVDYVFQHAPITNTANLVDSFMTLDQLNYSPSIFGDIVTIKGIVVPNSRVAFLYNGVVGFGTVQYIDWSPVQDTVVISVFSQYYSILNNLNSTSITVPISQCALLPTGYR